MLSSYHFLFIFIHDNRKLILIDHGSIKIKLFYRKPKLKSKNSLIISSIRKSTECSELNLPKELSWRVLQVVAKQCWPKPWPMNPMSPFCRWMDRNSLKWSVCDLCLWLNNLWQVYVWERAFTCKYWCKIWLPKRQKLSQMSRRGNSHFKLLAKRPFRNRWEPWSLPKLSDTIKE